MNPPHSRSKAFPRFQLLFVVACLAELTPAAFGGTDQDLERDRAAILSMAGSFEVRFQFEERVACVAGYQLEPAYEEHASELVCVIEDTPDRISLQHLLVVDADSDEPLVVKHWRQDWVFEDREMLVYRGHDLFETVFATEDEARGTWTQAVYQVGDAPRYEGRGRWVHLGQTSTWESDETWRPLPRRERSRDDYHVLVGRNRHTVTPDAWFHEQTNRKLVLDALGSPVGVRVHELGLNGYVRCDPARLEPASRYWTATASFWSEVRATWQVALAQPGRRWIDGGRTVRTLSGLADDFLAEHSQAEHSQAGHSQEGGVVDAAERSERIRAAVLSSIVAAAPEARGKPEGGP